MGVSLLRGSEESHSHNLHYWRILELYDRWTVSVTLGVA